MQFSRHDIFISGRIEDGDYRKFIDILTKNNLTKKELVTVHLDSDGGSMQEALAIGNLISLFEFSTVVDREASDPLKSDPGQCLSACAITFIGGKYRFLGHGSFIGVHQFHFNQPDLDPNDAVSVGQILSAELSEFIIKNKVDIQLISVMSLANPEEIFILDSELLSNLNILNHGIASEDWHFNIAEGIPYLSIQQEASTGSSKLLLYCDNGIPVGAASIEPGQDHGIGTYERSVGFFVDGSLSKFSKNDILLQPEMYGSSALFKFRINKPLLEKILSAKSVGAAILQLNEDFYWGFNIDVQDNNRYMIRDIFFNCSYDQGMAQIPRKKPPISGR